MQTVTEGTQIFSGRQALQAALFLVEKRVEEVRSNPLNKTSARALEEVARDVVTLTRNTREFGPPATRLVNAPSLENQIRIELRRAAAKGSDEAKDDLNSLWSYLPAYQRTYREIFGQGTEQK